MLHYLLRTTNKEAIDITQRWSVINNLILYVSFKPHFKKTLFCKNTFRFVDQNIKSFISIFSIGTTQKEVNTLDTRIEMCKTLCIENILYVCNQLYLRNSKCQVNFKRTRILYQMKWRIVHIPFK